jgi:hypothetical protein
MPFGPENVLLVYNDADLESEEISTAYGYSRSIPDSNIMAVTTDTDVSFDNLAEYQSTLETPVINKINQLRGAGVPIACVLLSFRIPTIVIDGTSKATSSLLSSCLLATRTAGTLNQHFLSFNEDDVAAGDVDFLSVFHLDAPTLGIARRRLNYISSIAPRTAINGYVYIDPNDRYENTVQAKSWIDSLSSAAQDSPFNNIVSELQINGTSSVFSRIIDGSIVFSSGVTFAGTGYFNDTSAVKSFFFNADVNGFSSPRDSSSQKPAMRALEEGYMVVAGMVADPSNVDNTHQYPDPRSVIYCSSRGIPMGCALIWSQRIVGEKLSVYGDPLASFIQESVGEAKFYALDGYFSAIDYMAQARAQSRAREAYAASVLRIVSAADDYVFKMKFISLAKSLAFVEDGISVGTLADPTSELRSLSKEAGYALFEDITVPSFEEIIQQSGRKIPLSFLRANIDSSLMISRIGYSQLQPKGISKVEFRIPTIAGSPRFFHMQTIGDDAEGNRVFSVDSINRPDLWRYEAEPGVMKTIPPEGIYTALAGRFIEFTQPEGFSSPLTRINGTFKIFSVGVAAQTVHQAEWRTQE